MYITQCIIAKNEENNIAHCLNHIKPIVNEQIVVDTGSTDRTVEIARNLGAKVYHFDWINDFSAARNFALEKAKGDWIIFLDCDEYFSNDSINYVPKVIQVISNHKNIDGINCELINVNSELKPVSTTKNASTRIFKRKKYLRYSNKVHETLKNIELNDANPILIDASEKLKIFHTGYIKDAVIKKNKNERNINLLLEELKENPTSSILNLYLSKQLNLSEKYEEGLFYSLKALEYLDNTTSYDYYCTIYSTVMHNMLNLSKPFNEIKKIFDEALTKFPGFPDYYFFIGESAIINNELDDSIYYLEQCIHHCEKYNSSIESISIVRLNEIYKQLLNLYILKEDKHKIVDVSVILLKVNKYDLEVLSTLIKTFLTEENEESVIQFLSKIYDYNNFKDKIYLIKACEKNDSNYMRNFYHNLLSEEELKAINI